MELHLGRLIDHVHLRVSDLEASKRFYRAALEPLGREIIREGPGFFFVDRRGGPDAMRPGLREVVFQLLEEEDE